MGIRQVCPQCGKAELTLSGNFVEKVPLSLATKLTMLGMVMIIPTAILIFLFQMPISGVAVFMIPTVVLCGVAVMFKKRSVIIANDFRCQNCGYTIRIAAGDAIPVSHVAAVKPTVPGPAKCRACGNTIPAGIGYCAYCGAKQ